MLEPIFWNKQDLALLFFSWVLSYWYWRIDLKENETFFSKFNVSHLSPIIWKYSSKALQKGILPIRRFRWFLYSPSWHRQISCSSFCEALKLCHYLTKFAELTRDRNAPAEETSILFPSSDILSQFQKLFYPWTKVIPERNFVKLFLHQDKSFKFKMDNFEEEEERKILLKKSQKDFLLI